MEGQIICAIAYNNFSKDEKCQNPTVEIISGGVNQASAAVKVTSQEGCGIHSDVDFITVRN